MSNSCSIFQFSTHFMLSRRAFLISEAECEGSIGATGVVAARRVGAGGAVVAEAEGKLGGSEAGTGGGGESALIWLSSSSSSRSVSSAVAVDAALCSFADLLLFDFSAASAAAATSVLASFPLLSDGFDFLLLDFILDYSNFYRFNSFKRLSCSLFYARFYR